MYLFKHDIEPEEKRPLSVSFSCQLQVPVTLASEISPPLLVGDTCQNIVSQVWILNGACWSVSPEGPHLPARGWGPTH